MPIQKDLKRRVRARMRKTGESYTSARARLLERKRRAPAASAREVERAPAVDLAALAGMSDAAVAKKTGRTWKEWVVELDRAGAAAMPHAEIARLLHDRLGVPDWWAQTVAVGYERIHGLRQKGQRRDGSYEVNKSKVYPVSIPELWKAFLRCKEGLDGETLRMSKATKEKSMRMRFTDGTPVDAYFWPKGPAKSQLSLQHTKLASRADAERLRTYWGERLAKIAELLADSR